MPTQTSAPLDLETEPEKYCERFDGQLVERNVGGGTHSDVQYNLLALLKPIAALRNARVRQEWSLAHADEWMTPDVMLSFPGELREDARGYLLAPAFLCIEIRSPSQSETELFRKCRRYRDWGVPHCWIIDPEAQACFEYHGGNDFILIDQHDGLNAGDIRVPASAIFGH